MRILPLLGLNRTCNFCNNSVEFKSIEDSIGSVLKKHGFPYELSDFETLNYKHYTCPECGSSDRDRLYKLYMEGNEKFSKSARILDFAPSKQIEGYLRPKASGYRSADLLVAKYDDKVDITNMKSYKDNTFDFFICSHVLEHVSSDTKALSELFRVLKPGGRGILMTPIIDKQGVMDEDPKVKKVEERWRRFAQDDHVRLYEKSVFLKRVKQAGFKVDEFTQRQLGPIKFWRHGISPKSCLYIVTKPERTK